MPTKSEQNFIDWLAFCKANASEHRELAFDDKGQLAPKVIPWAALPFEAHQAWTYFEDAKSRGLLSAPDGLKPNYFRFQLNERGLTFLQDQRLGWLEVQLNALKQNIVTVAVSVIAAVATAYVLKELGLQE